MKGSTIVPETHLLNQVKDTLKRVWGFDSLRPVQQEVVESALNNRDAVVVMPTGGGKSLCFQLPAILTNRLTVVVSPLIALMKDQVDALTMVGVSAAAMNSSLSEVEIAEIELQVANGTLNLLYVSPERLLLPATLRLLALANHGQGVARFAIDEAHCISAWGHDFRPEFRQLGKIKETFPGIPIQAFTATATPKVQRDIAIQLNLEKPRKFVGVFDRPNLTYRVVAKDDPVRRTVEAVRRYPDEGVIVYCLSRKDTESIANALVAQGIPAVAYHAGLPNETRKKVSEDFARERANIVVATIAFGMGIDRANVRCVIHECLPKSMEGYQQETGRAGRDGLPSECVLLYNHGDVVRLKRLLTGGEKDVQDHHIQLLEEVRRFATSHRCRHKSLSEHFGQPYEVPAEGCGACDVCLGGMEKLADSSETGHTILATALELLETGQGRSFGVGFLVSVLNGSKVKQVLERKGDEAVGFGAFKSESPERIQSWIHQILDLGLLEVTEGQYPVLAITEAGITALEAKSEIELVENVALNVSTTTKKSKAAAALIPGVDEALYEKLRAWRREVSADRAVPAYVIFHDATLMRIAATRPSTTEALKQISGVGSHRGDEFGQTLTDLVRLHCEQAGISLDETPPTVQIVKPPTLVSPKTAGYFALFRQGLDIESIASQLDLKPSTIWGHLATWIEAEAPDSIETYVDSATYARITSVLIHDQTGHLKPIFEALGGECTYDQIRVVKAFNTSKSRLL